ncbi:MAG: hypothetical protein HYX67_11445 [Candidatus Melainabacteria bacterium]|nr:hypothetical protein [Candidatus Melainabacteria bacterium]
MTAKGQTLTKALWLAILLVVCLHMEAIAADPGRTSLSTMADQYLQQYPEAKWLRDDIRDANNNPIPGYVNPALIRGAAPFGTFFPPTPAAAMGWATDSKSSSSNDECHG